MIRSDVQAGTGRLATTKIEMSDAVVSCTHHHGEIASTTESKSCQEIKNNTLIVVGTIVRAQVARPSVRWMREIAATASIVDARRAAIRKVATKAKAAATLPTIWSRTPISKRKTRTQWQPSSVVKVNSFGMVSSGCHASVRKRTSTRCKKT